MINDTFLNVVRAVSDELMAPFLMISFRLAPVLSCSDVTLASYPVDFNFCQALLCVKFMVNVNVKKQL